MKTIFVLFALAASTFAANNFSATVAGSANLVGYWRLGEASGNITDSSPSGSTGVPHGGMTYSQAGAITSDSNTAVAFDGSTGYFDFANQTPYNFEYNQPFSVCAWANNTSGTGGTILAKMTPDSTNRGWWFELNGTTLRMWIISTYSTAYLQAVGSVTVGSGYHYLCMTYDGSHTAAGVALWVDGINGAVVSNDTLGTNTVLNAQAMSMGSRTTFCCGYNGILDEVAVWSRQLGGIEIQTYYAMGLKQTNQLSQNTGSVPGLIYDNDSAQDVDNFYATWHVAAWAKLGYANLLGYVDSSTSSAGVVCQDLVLRFLGLHPKIGAYQGLTGDTGDETGCTAYAATYMPGISRTAYPSPASVYRSLLTAASNSSVVIVAAGTMQNLYDFLNDGGSPSAATLIAQKVTGLYIAAGSYPTGTEYNYFEAAVGANYLFANWPTAVPIQLLDNLSATAGCSSVAQGFGVYSSYTGSPLYQLLNINQRVQVGRASWDDCAVIRALLDPSNAYFSVAASNGLNTVNSALNSPNAGAAGFNSWTATPHNNQSYLGNVASNFTIQSLLNSYLYKYKVNGSAAAQ